VIACLIKNQPEEKKPESLECELYDFRTESSGERNEKPSADHCDAGAATGSKRHSCDWG
jgi:hypothetical protein